MKEKENYKGSVYAVAGMALMAHKFGVSVAIKLTDTNISDEVFEYEAILHNPPKADWTLDSNDKESVKQNRKAVLFRNALVSGSVYGHAIDPDINDNFYKHWDKLIDQQHDECISLITDFLGWHGKEDSAPADLERYLQDVFDTIARDTATKKSVPQIAECTILNGGIMTAPEIRELVNPSIPFGVLEYVPPALYPTWYNSLCNVDYSCK